MNSIELNGSFYSLQRPKSFQAWHDATPEDFVFAVKAPQYITHIRRLQDVETPLANFFASGLFRLGKKLGPILWQLPPSLCFDRAVIAAFLEMLPRDLAAAGRLARQHDEWMKDRAALDPLCDGPVRHAMEVRHASFATPEFIELLRAQNVAVVVADTAGKWPFMEDVTADFVYARLHGDKKIYVSGYTEESLDEWARKICSWKDGHTPRETELVTTEPPPKAAVRDVYVYFDNDVKVRAPYDAQSLAKRVGAKPTADFTA